MTRVPSGAGVIKSAPMKTNHDKGQARPQAGDATPGMTREPSGAGRIKSAQPIPPRFHRPDENEPRQSPGVDRKAVGAKAPAKTGSRVVLAG